MPLLTGDLAQAVFDGFRGLLLTGELRREIKSGVLDDYGDPVGNTIEYFSIEGFSSRYSAFYRAQAQIPETDVKVSIFAKSNDGLVPRKDDKVIMNGVWYQLREVSVDPAGALYVCQAFVISPPVDAS